MYKKILTLSILLVMIFTVVPVHNEVEAKPKKGSVVTINKKQYIYQGTVKKYYPAKYCKLVNKYAKNSQSFTNLVAGTSGFATFAKKAGYAGVLASSLYIANLGVQNNTTIYKNAARKGTGLQVSYDLYVPQTGHNYGLTRNTKVVSK
uniref:Uncharacterized protein n=1 Tax=Staphylococcus aureus TaxID=1280 RepID=D2JCV0_STAAU|nr:hypothetical protein [Staphylococcus aureus]ACZ66040.1 hypothetical protein SAP111B_003 [Staphylococcus aureus]